MPPASLSGWSEALYEGKAAVTLTSPSATPYTLGIAGYNSIPTVQVIAAAP